MTKRAYIPIDVDNLPEIFEFDIGVITYYIGINYNTVDESFTLDLYDMRMNPIVLGEVLILDSPLWADCGNDKLPLTTLIPMDESGNETVITKSNLMKTVFLYIDTEG